MTTVDAKAGVSRRNEALQRLTGPVVAFLTGSTWARRRGAPGVMDFVVGNPQEMPLPASSMLCGAARTARQRLVCISDGTDSMRVGRQRAARAARGRVPGRGRLLTTGVRGLSVALKTLINPARGAPFISPPVLRGVDRRRGRRCAYERSHRPSRLTSRPCQGDHIADAAGELAEQSTGRITGDGAQGAGERWSKRRRPSDDGSLLSDEAYSRIVRWTTLRESDGVLSVIGAGVHVRQDALTPGQRIGYPPCRRRCHWPNGTRARRAHPDQVVTGTRFRTRSAARAARVGAAIHRRARDRAPTG
jgi:hypothetical protein